MCEYVDLVNQRCKKDNRICPFINDGALTDKMEALCSVKYIDDIEREKDEKEIKVQEKSTQITGEKTITNEIQI